MSETSFPRPFDEIRDAVSMEESWRATEHFTELIRGTMLGYAPEVRSRQATEDVSVQELQMLTEDAEYGKVFMRLSAIEGMILRTTMINLAWQDGERRTTSTSYYVGVESGVVTRRDTDSLANEMRIGRMRELLGKEVEDATDEELIAARMAMHRESEANRTFEQSNGYNDLPVDSAEIAWLGGLLVTASVVEAKYE